jgi:hypothetical protein
MQISFIDSLVILRRYGDSRYGHLSGQIKADQKAQLVHCHHNHNLTITPTGAGRLPSILKLLLLNLPDAVRAPSNLYERGWP